jgi:type I restriction enzyme M protein
MATVVPHGVLFRGGAEGKIREGILKDDLFQAVIGFPQNLFYGASIPAAVVILNKNKPEEKKGKVIFIDASEGYVKDGNKNRLREEDIERIVKTYHDFKDVERYARVVDLKEIEENDHNLNISRYVDTTEEEEEIDIHLVLESIRQREEDLAQSREKLNSFLQDLGFERI